MKPSRGLLRPARCAVALVQLAAPTGGLVQATGAADIKRALRGWARAAGARGEGRRSPANPNPNPNPKPKPKPKPDPDPNPAQVPKPAWDAELAFAEGWLEKESR